MLDLNNVIRNDGSNLIISFAILDIDGNAQTSSQGFQTNILRLSDSKWWNTGSGDFDLGTEPGLITGAQVGTTGIYQYILSSGFNNSSFDYIVRLKGITTILFDFYANCRIIPDMTGTILSVDAALDAANTKLSSPANADTGSIRGWLQTMINLMKNKKTETSVLQTIRNEDDDGNFATRAISDAAGTLTVDEAT